MPFARSNAAPFRRYLTSSNLLHAVVLALACAKQAFEWPFISRQAANMPLGIWISLTVIDLLIAVATTIAALNRFIPRYNDRGEKCKLKWSFYLVNIIREPVLWTWTILIISDTVVYFFLEPLHWSILRVFTFDIAPLIVVWMFNSLTKRWDDRRHWILATGTLMYILAVVFKVMARMWVTAKEVQGDHEGWYLTNVAFALLTHIQLLRIVVVKIMDPNTFGIIPHTYVHYTLIPLDKAVTVPITSAEEEIICEPPAPIIHK